MASRLVCLGRFFQNLSLLIIQIHIVIWNNGCFKKKRKKPKFRKTSSASQEDSITCSGEIQKKKALYLSLERFPQHLLDVQLASTQPEEVLETKSSQTLQKGQEEIKGSRSKEKSRRLLPYPEVKPPTFSQKKRREAELEREKREKIASGFYQSRSDEDDTLEKVNSLKEEITEQSRKRSHKTRRSIKDKMKDPKEIDNEDVREMSDDVLGKQVT
ncbi:hypothetical protein DICVIV_11937 [Dictyocaulus viviparus]|uniref:Uncharacterized protein n=1 Tax=Dictyocaulus viviparus TaxID=29172 RepID=A0A0D8XEI5_DICVI|nr:hypothetical protein DICVIV_11937 [Dictyocaulus viviparus]